MSLKVELLNWNFSNYLNSVIIIQLTLPIPLNKLNVLATKKYFLSKI